MYRTIRLQEFTVVVTQKPHQCLVGVGVGVVGRNYSVHNHKNVLATIACYLGISVTQHMTDTCMAYSLACM